jgi:hypothetical protein
VTWGRWVGAHRNDVTLQAESDVTTPELDVNELTGATADLEAVSARLDEMVGEVERLETLLDIVLDDPALVVCVLDEDVRIAALSRGFVDRWSDAQAAPGRRFEDVSPKGWSDVRELMASVTADQWETRPVEGGVLSARRAKLPDGAAGASGGDAGSFVVLRFVERAEGGRGAEGPEHAKE